MKKSVHKKNKKGAIELSIGTIVIIVLAMSMLILGLVLVKNIFSGAKYNVVAMNDKVKDEINKLFVEDKKAVIYLDNNGAEITQGDASGIGWAIMNKIATQRFRWQVTVQDDRIGEKCGVSQSQAEKWISTGATGNVEVASGSKYYDVIVFNIPEDSVSDVSQCLVRFHLEIKKEDGTAYETLPFNVQIA